MPKEIRVSAIQMDCLPGEITRNLGHAETMVESAVEQGGRAWKKQCQAVKTSPLIGTRTTPSFRRNTLMPDNKDDFTFLVPTLLHGNEKKDITSYTALLLKKESPELAPPWLVSARYRPCPSKPQSAVQTPANDFSSRTTDCHRWR